MRTKQEIDFYHVATYISTSCYLCQFWSDLRYSYSSTHRCYWRLCFFNDLWHLRKTGNITFTMCWYSYLLLIIFFSLYLTFVLVTCLFSRLYFYNALRHAHKTGNRFIPCGNIDSNFLLSLSVTHWPLLK